MLEGFLTETVPWAIESRNIFTFIIVFAGGLFTSFSPCIVSMLPVLVSYIGSDNSTNKSKGFLLSFSFVAGLAVTFSILGFIAAYLGLIFGQVGANWYFILAAVAIIMGLYLLEVFSFNMPGLSSLPMNTRGKKSSFLMGLLFGLVASPCATPVLAVIITYAAAQGEPFYGSSLLFIYGIGHGLPLIIAGTFTAVIRNMGRIRGISRYFNYIAGSALVLFGLYLLALATW